MFVESYDNNPDICTLSDYTYSVYIYLYMYYMCSQMDSTLPRLVRFISIHISVYLC